MGPSGKVGWREDLVSSGHVLPTFEHHKELAWNHLCEILVLSIDRSDILSDSCGFELYLDLDIDGDIDSRLSPLGNAFLSSRWVGS